jgi:hypothetical protein
VYQDGYGVLNEAWVKEKPGWGDQRHHLVEQMNQARRAFGWDHYADTGTLTFGDGGFTFTGTVTTPPRHWETLAAAIPAEMRARLKSLSA